MSKILFISNISHKITSFVTASISAAHELGFDFYYASNRQNATENQNQEDEDKYNIRIK